MKTKHLFLTLMMLLASATLSWGRVVTDEIFVNGSTVSFSNNSGASYNLPSMEEFYIEKGLIKMLTDAELTARLDGAKVSSFTIRATRRNKISYWTENALGQQIEGNDVTINASSGEFSFVATGDAVFFGFYTLNDCEITSMSITWELPDPATEVALVAEYDGLFYAMDHSLNPVRVQVVDGQLVRPAAATLAAITWYRRPSTAADAQPGDYTLETAENGGQYLYSGRDGMALGTTPAKPLYVVGGYYHYDNNNTFVTCQGSNFVFATSGAENAAKEYLVSSIVDYNASKHTFTRNFANTYFATICLPYSVALEDVEDYADFYTVAGTQRDASDNVTSLVMQIVESNLEAGVPYIILPKSTGDIDFPLNGTKFSGNDHPTAYGLVGNLSSTTLTLGAGYYALSKNTLYHLVGAGKLNVGQYKAGYDLDGLTTGQKVTVLSGSEAHAPGRIVLDFNDSNAATGVENVESAALNWNEPVYNLMGQQVAEGATGVFIQNGKKFMIY